MIRQYRLFYAAGILASAVMFILPVFLGPYIQLFGCGLLFLGITFSTLPFVPLSVVNKYGTMKTRRIMRAIGYLMAAIGLVILFMPLFF